MTRQELLDAEITSRSEARRYIDAALRHYRTARRATIQVMADLRRLQDNGVHLLYGEQNFSIWAENTFDGLAAGNVRQLTRAGGVALELERRKLIDLDKPEGYVGTTGLRELSVVSNDFGDDKMAEVFIAARYMKDFGEVSGTTVKAALTLLMPPANPELVTSSALRDDDDEDDEYEEDKQPPKVRELISRIQDLAWDLPESVDELEHTNAQLKAELEGKDTTNDETWIANRG